MIFWEDDNIKIFWTHIIRDINLFKMNKDDILKDLTTPYGYGGPIIKILNKNKFIDSFNVFFNEYQSYCRDKGYICEFIRFHPIFQNWNFIKNNPKIKIDYSNDVVVIDLKNSIEIIRNSMKKNKRYQIRKSEEKKCSIEIIDNPSQKDMGLFTDLYYQTMDKNKASGKYYFERDFLENHFLQLKNKIIMVNAIYDSKLISSSLFIHTSKIIHYYLSGSQKIKGIYPADLIIWEVVKWAKKRDIDLFHLGGGRGSNDSLFSFKKGFSNLILPFHVGKIIFDKKKYDKLCLLNEKIDGDDTYFPAYRKGYTNSII